MLPANIYHLYTNSIITSKIVSILGGSLVTTEWHVLRLRMEEMPYSFGEEMGVQ
jgi:hypothetical protein